LDSYVIVAELELPAGELQRWLDSPLVLKRRPSPSVAAVLAAAEGDVRAEVDGDRLSLRASLVDAAYFAVVDGLRAGFALAEKLGGRGAWYAGDHISGKLGQLGGDETSAKVAQLPDDVRRWVDEAARLGDAPPARPPKARRAPSTSKKRSKR